MNIPIRISVFEDNSNLRQSLTQLFTYEKDFALCGTFPDCNVIEKHIPNYLPEMILMDIDMPGINGIEGLKKVLAIAPETIIVMFTIFEDEDKIFDAICAGAKGYILKKTNNEKLLEALKDIYNGGSYMTPVIARKVLQMFCKPPQAINNEYNLSDREKEVLKLLVEGYSYKMIAAKCEVTHDTVRHHIKNIYQKLKVNSNVEAVKKAMIKKLV
jgi:DNA-binding NarL/FixJ family response regulator